MSDVDPALQPDGECREPDALRNYRQATFFQRTDLNQQSLCRGGN
jgi:hypothetical protein